MIAEAQQTLAPRDKTGPGNNAWLNSIISNLAPYSELYIQPGEYIMDGILTIPKPCSVFGYGATFNWPGDISHHKGIDITSSDVQIHGLTLDGPQAISSSVQNGINAYGNSSSYISNIKLVDLDISNFGSIGISLKYSKKFEIKGCYIHSLFYGGIMLISSSDGLVHNNTINSVNVVGLGVGYGIIVTRYNNDSLIVEPRSSDIIVSHNIIKNVYDWEGLDTHGGERIKFDSNIVTGCKIGIVVGPAGGSSGNSAFAPMDCTVTNNTVNSLSESGDKSFGIAFIGAFSDTPVQYAQGSITGNTIVNHSDQANAISGAMYHHTTSGLLVSSNRIINASPCAIHMYHGNKNFQATGNTIIDAWSDTVPSIGIHSASNNNSGLISNNILSRDTKSAISVMEQGIYILPSPTNDVTIDSNFERIL